MTQKEFTNLVGMLQTPQNHPLIGSILNSKATVQNILAFILIAHELFIIKDIDDTSLSTTQTSLKTTFRSILSEVMTSKEVNVLHLDFGSKVFISELMVLLNNNSKFQTPININYLFDTYIRILNKSRELLLSSEVDTSNPKITDEASNNPF